MGAAFVLGGLALPGRTLAAGDVNEAACPGETESSPGFRNSLPDCRAYEIVSEANTGDTANLVGAYGFPDGKHVYYKMFLPTPGAGVRSGVSERFLATRTASSWVQRAISPPQGEGPSLLDLAAQENAEGVSFIEGFSEAFVKSPFEDPFESPQLNQTVGMGAYRLSLDGGGETLMSLPDSGELTQPMIEAPAVYAPLANQNDWGGFLAGGSADGSRAFFVTTAKLATAPGTPPDTHEASNEIYERTDGHTYLVGVLPDGSVPACGAEVGQGMGTTVNTQPFYSYGAIAPRGANVVFFSPGPQAGLVGVSCGEGGGLFLRDVVHDTTVRLPGALFAGRAGTGAGEEEKIFTIDRSSIYEYHVGTGQTTEVGAGDLLTYSADGSRVYFLGPEEGIYVYHEGEETKSIRGTQAGGYREGLIGGGLIEAIGKTDYGQTRNMPVATAGSSDGSQLLFIDSAQLTEYKNEGHFEAYIYDASTEKVTCISCNPTGAPPREEAREPSEVTRAQLVEEHSLDIGEEQYQTPSPPLVSDDGSRAVFETNEALVPQDVNGAMDIYEWEREGAEGCSTESLHVEHLAESAAYSAVDGGCLYLLSSGLGQEVPNENDNTSGTHLIGASQGLKDIYVQTSDSLLPGLDNASKLYDVRIDGGFPYTVNHLGCEAGQCSTAPGEAAAQSEYTTESFFGSTGVSGAVHVHRGHKQSDEQARRRKLGGTLKTCRRHKRKRRRIACEHAARKTHGMAASSSGWGGRR
jgi:hypothetical protein